MILYYLLSTVYVLVCFLLLMVILLQQGTGDMAAAFGGGGSQSAFGARSGATLLSKATWLLAVLFMVSAMACDHRPAQPLGISDGRYGGSSRARAGDAQLELVSW